MFNSLALKQEYMFLLENVAKTSGEEISKYGGTVGDTEHKHGSEESNIDIFAFKTVLGALEERMRRLPEKDRFVGKYLFESHELQDLKGKIGSVKGYLRIDEIDGTTNAKRESASEFDYKPLSAVSMALSEDLSLTSIVLGTLFDMYEQSTWSGMRVEGGYMAFHNGKLLDPKKFTEPQGDSCLRLIVADYCHTDRIKNAQIEQALINADKNKKYYRPYGGCRATSQDILNIIRNQSDAYIDPRALWPGNGAMLYPYDVAGVIPIALGCGLEVSDIHGNPLDMYKSNNDPLTLIVARKGMKDKFVEILKPVIENMKRGADEPTKAA
jgi:fructose-1,6-bisphosphatase/inositol monophosphatase family enzyme